MFDFLSGRIDDALKSIKKMDIITEGNIDKAIREIRMALLEADVNYEVAKEFTKNVKEKAIGQDVSKSLKPDEVFFKLIKDEMLSLFGENIPLIIKNKTIVMLIGLQGSGKTTTAGKISNLVRKKYNKKPLLVACDVYRPAAIDQLHQIGKELNIPVYSNESKDVNFIIKEALLYSEENSLDYIIIDTAGRLHIDDKLMEELISIKENYKVDETLLVIDAMMGQDAINVIKGFDEKLKISGSVLTKMDGDTKGGVAISLKHLTNVPIKLIGDSEKLDGITEFNKQRIVNRILDMGDLLSIIDKADGLIDENDAKDLSKKMNKGTFDLNDFLKTMNQMKKLGPLDSLVKMIPGARKMGLNKINIDQKDLAHIEAIILSMTQEEREKPKIIKHSRKKRISKGSGRSVEEINRLLKQFEEMKKMMKNISSGKMKMPF